MTRPSSSGSRLRFVDLLRSGAQGLKTRPGRTMLTALGIAIGIASLVAVLGISASSRAALLRQIEQLGTNLLAVRAGQSLFGDAATLPETAQSMIRRIPPVEDAAAITALDATVRRTDLIPETETGGVTVFAAEPQVLATLEGTLHQGRFLNEGLTNLPVMVLGSVAAERLGINDLSEGPLVFIDGTWFAVIGLLEPLPLSPDLDRAVFVGYDIAGQVLGAEAHASTIYLRTDNQSVEAVRSILARTANPEAPNEVQVSRPSDALEASAAVDENLTRLLLGLGAVALGVGGVGIANVMVISVLERRPEIGLRRALGAKRVHIGSQFLLESLQLSAIGGLTGIGLGALITSAYATGQGWLVDVPAEAMALGVAGSLVVGALAGLYPAVRAARMDPAEAVHPTA